MAYLFLFFILIFSLSHSPSLLVLWGMPPDQIPPLYLGKLILFWSTIACVMDPKGPHLNSALFMSRGIVSTCALMICFIILYHIQVSPCTSCPGILFHCVLRFHVSACFLLFHVSSWCVNSVHQYLTTCCSHQSCQAKTPHLFPPIRSFSIATYSRLTIIWDLVLKL